MGMRKLISVAVTMALAALTLSACEKEKINVPDVTGKTLSEAKKTLTDEGFLYDAKDANGVLILTGGEVVSQDPRGGEQVTEKGTVKLVVETEAQKKQRKWDEEQQNKAKLKSLADSLKGKELFEAINTAREKDALGSVKAKNGTTSDLQRFKDDADNGVKWVVVDTNVVSQRIDLIADTEGNVQKEVATQQQDKALSEKLSKRAALAACRARGEELYPYGFKSHDSVGVIQDFTPENENTWFYKARVDITNGYGAKAKGLAYECHVTGTTSSPEVVDFKVY